MLVAQTLPAVFFQALSQRFRIGKRNGCFNIIFCILLHDSPIISCPKTIQRCTVSLIPVISNADGRILNHIHITLILRHGRQKGMTGPNRAGRKGILRDGCNHCQCAIRDFFHQRFRSIQCVFRPVRNAGRQKKQNSEQMTWLHKA